MSLSPTTGLGQLSLESMPPTTRSQSQRPSSEAGASTAAGLSQQQSQPDDSEFDVDDLDVDDPDDPEIDQNDNIIRSPFTNLIYDISRLPTQESSQTSGGLSSQRAQQSQQATSASQSPETDVQGSIRELFNKDLLYHTPPITIQWCGLNTTEGFYGFQLHENVPLSIRIGSHSSPHSRPTCSCGKPQPCPHLVWLLDAIAKLTLVDHDSRDPLILGENGTLSELPNLYSHIADFRLDLLANGLHCDIGPLQAVLRKPPNNPVRARETKQVLSAFDGFEDEDPDSNPSDVDPFRHIEESSRSSSSAAAGAGTGGAGGSSRQGAMEPPRPKKLDVRETLRKLLHSSPEAFSMLVNCLPPREKVRNPYYQLEYRAECVLQELEQYSKSLTDSAIAADRQSRGADLEVVCNVPWAARQLYGACQQLYSLIKDRPSNSPGAAPAQQPTGSTSSSQLPSLALPPLETWEKVSAAHALVYILHRVVFDFIEDLYPGDTPDCNLYEYLIGRSQATTGFVIDALALLPDQNQYVSELDKIFGVMGDRGANPHIYQGLQAIIARMKSGTSSTGGRGSGAGGGSVPPPSPPPSSSLLAVPSFGAGPGGAAGPSSGTGSSRAGASGRARNTRSSSGSGSGSGTASASGSGAGSKRPGSRQEHQVKRAAR